MVIERLEIANVRNLASVAIELSGGLNFFVGANGAGKTAVLEAVHVLLRGRSFRSNRIGSVIRNGSDSMSVFASGLDETRGRLALGVEKDRQNRTELRVNGQSMRQASAVAGVLPVQVMLPDLSELVFGGPEQRRQWLDWGTFHVKPDYLDTLKQYTRALRQRNALLKLDDRASLASWSEQYVELGESVHDARTSYLASVSPAVEGCLQHLAPGMSIELQYASGFRGDSLREELARSLEGDVKSGVTRAGPHRADVRILSEGAPAATQFSRGQGKVVASALRLGQATSLRATKERDSLFLIDDIGAELDELNSNRFYGLLRELGCQILATSTHIPAFKMPFSGDRVRMFHVKQGQIPRAQS